MPPKNLPPLCLFLLIACSGGSGPSPAPTPPPPPPSGCDATGLAVTLAAPSEPVTTRGEVSVALTVSGQAEKVQLLRDGLVLAELPPPYTYAWDTTSVEDGTYSLQGRATCGAAQVRSAAQTVVVDHTPPSLMERSPAPGGEAATGSLVRVDFSEPLLPSSVTPDALTLLVDGQPVAATLGLSQDGRTLTLTPAQPLRPPARVEVTLAAGLTDAVGNALVPPAPWAFSVPRWLAAHGVVPAPGFYGPYAQLPLLQLDGAGRPAVAFRAANSPTGSHQLRSWRWTDREWTELEDVGGSQVLAVAFAMGAGDRVLLVDLLEVGGERLDIHYFTPSGTYLDDYIFYCLQPAAAMGPQGPGLVACVYPNVSDTPDYIAILGSDDSGTVDIPSLESDLQDVKGLSLPALAVDAEGRPVVAALNGHGHLVVSRWNGRAWTQLGASLPTRGFSGEPTVRVDASGRPVVAWREADDGGSRVFVHRLVDGAWARVGPLTAVAAPPASAPSLAMELDGQGHPVLAWTEAGDSAKVQVWRASSSGWTSLGAVSRAGADVLVGRDALVVDARGQPVLATVVRAGSRSDVQLWRPNRLDP